MKSFKGFAHNGTTVNNAKDAVAAVGELSAISTTFTRDQTKFIQAITPGYMLRGFSYYVDDVVTQFPAADANKILNIISWAYTQATGGFFTSAASSVNALWLTDQAGTYDLTEVGAMQVFNTNKYCPSYLVFAPKNDANTTWKIWFTNTAFFAQFDETEIKHAKPLASLDSFFTDYTHLKPLLAARTLSDTVAQFDTYRGNTPETRIRSDVFTWVDQLDKTLTIPVEWPSLIWGEAGNNLDRVKESLATFILANSTKTREQWAAIFPDIFTSTEIIISPLWDEFSVAERQRGDGIYRGTGNMMTGIARAKLLCKGVKYTATHIQAVANDMPTQYKSLRCVVVGGPENRDGKTQFVQWYPDWMNVPTTHVDFMRMSANTRGAVMVIMDLLELAEEMTLTTPAPSGYSRMSRDGVAYIAKSYGGLLHMAVLKDSFKAIVG